MQIVRFPAPGLRCPATPVTVFGASLAALASDMLALMHAHGGIGLAANQAGSPACLLVAEVPGQTAKPLAIANPRLIEASGHMASQEGCLSLPGIAGVVPRAARIRLAGQDCAGEPLEIEAEGLLAAVMQHEMDHLQGHLFIDRLSRLRRDMLLRRFHKLHRPA